MGEIVNIGGIPVMVGDFFGSAEEADGWLPFDDPCERMAYACPDQYAEWERWRATDALVTDEMVLRAERAYEAAHLNGHGVPGPSPMCCALIAALRQEDRP